MQHRWRRPQAFRVAAASAATSLLQCPRAGPMPTCGDYDVALVRSKFFLLDAGCRRIVRQAGRSICQLRVEKRPALHGSTCLLKYHMVLASPKFTVACMDSHSRWRRPWAFGICSLTQTWESTTTAGG